jgi:hypothetical protein
MKTSSASPPPPPPPPLEEKVCRHVESVSLSDLLVEADVILQSSTSSASSFSSTTTATKNSKMSSPRFGNKVGASTTDDDDDDDDDNNNNKTTALFPRALLKRLKPAFASFCRRFHHRHRQQHTGDDSRLMFTMNSNAWLSVLTESNLLSKTFSASRAIGCFENVVFSRRRESIDEREKKKRSAGHDDDEEEEEEECGNGERRITFEEFATLLGEAVAKAYDVEAKAVGKRVVATAYAMERKREEEERRKEAFVSDAVVVGGGDDDDDDDDDYYEYELRYGVGNIGNNNANNISRRPRTMATTQPVATSSKSVTNKYPGMPVSPSSPSSSSSWRIRAERYTNRYNNRSSLDGDYLASSSSLAAANSARGRYRYDETDEEDILLEDRVANAFETVFCQSLATTTGPSSSSSAFRLGGGGGAGGGERRKRKTIDEREFVKICTACALIGNGFTASDCLDVAFAVGADEKNGEITTRAFLRALRKIASAHDVSFADVARRVVAVSKALLLRER